MFLRDIECVQMECRWNWLRVVPIEKYFTANVDPSVNTVTMLNGTVKLWL